MKIPNVFSRKRTPVLDTAPRRLDDVDTQRREAVTHLLRPDSLSPRSLPSGARDADATRDADSVMLAISRLGSAGGIDEFVPDTLDGVIDAWRAQWDSRVDELLPEQVLTSMRLAGQELENLTACAARVQALRATVTELDVEINNWRGVLRGEITHLPFPQTSRASSPTEVDLSGLLADATLGAAGRAAYGQATGVGIDALPHIGNAATGLPARQVPSMHTDIDPGNAAAN